MNGRRRDFSCDDPTPRLESGEYGKHDGLWYCVPPGKDWFHFTGCLGDGASHHKVIEHEDGTITVNPSILITSHVGTWHGFLEKGVWREV